MFFLQNYIIQFIFYQNMSKGFAEAAGAGAGAGAAAGTGDGAYVVGGGAVLPNAFQPSPPIA